MSNIAKVPKKIFSDKICTVCGKEAEYVHVIKEYGEFRCEEHKDLPFVLQEDEENPSYRTPSRVTRREAFLPKCYGVKVNKTFDPCNKCDFLEPCIRESEKKELKRRIKVHYTKWKTRNPHR